MNEAIRLPDIDGFPSTSLRHALERRHSSRAFSPQPIPLPVLSQLLWAACGINRPETGGHTAPSAHGWRDVDVYVATKDGVYQYAPLEHALRLVKQEDLRQLTGTQEFVADAPLNLLYISDLDKMHDVAADDSVFLAAADASFIAQNVNLYCAAAGLACVVRAMVDRPSMAMALSLLPTQRIVLAHTVGFSA